MSGKSRKKNKTKRKQRVGAQSDPFGDGFFNENGNDAKKTGGELFAGAQRGGLQPAAEVRGTEQRGGGALDPDAQRRHQPRRVLAAAAHRLPQGLRGRRRAAAQARRPHRRRGAHVLARTAQPKLRGALQEPGKSIQYSSSSTLGCF